MAVSANIEDLEHLYDQMNTSMLHTDTMISNIDSKFHQARQEWKSAGADRFDDEWNNTFKPTLIRLCQSLAAAGSSVAEQHKGFKYGAQEEHSHRHLTPLQSPR